MLILIYYIQITVRDIKTTDKIIFAIALLSALLLMTTAACVTQFVQATTMGQIMKANPNEEFSFDTKSDGTTVWKNNKLGTFTEKNNEIISSASTLDFRSSSASGLSSTGESTTTLGNTPWQEFGVFLGPIQKHTGVFHNENGVFIPWKTLCSASQSYLLESCGSLITPDGTLTSAGDTAVVLRMEP
jgi:hypothetical protein